MATTFVLAAKWVEQIRYSHVEDREKKVFSHKAHVFGVGTYRKVPLPSWDDRLEAAKIRVEDKSLVVRDEHYRPGEVWWQWLVWKG